MKCNFDIIVNGDIIDQETRCIHYNSDLDIIAIKFFCCKKFYPCYLCHNQYETHKIVKWKKDEKAIFCGKCKSQYKILQYITNNDKCIYCNSKLNPFCKNHYHLYFDQKLLDFNL